MFFYVFLGGLMYYLYQQHKSKPVIQIERMDENIDIPIQKKSGYHLEAYCPEGDINIPPKQTIVVRTGLILTLPSNKIDLHVRSLPGLSRQGIVVSNIETDNNDEMLILLYNRSSSLYKVKHKEPIALALFQPVFHPTFKEHWFGEEHIKQS